MSFSRVVIKPIKNQEGYYVSNTGLIYSQWINKGMHGLVKGNDLKQLKGSRANKQGHLMFRFGRSGSWNLIHRIVYETFVGEIGEGLVIRHKNDIPNDNRVENLEIGTQKDNVQDTINAKRNPFGERCWNAKLTNEDVHFIRANAHTKTHKEIAKTLGVSRRTVGRVINGDTWRHVEEETHVK